MSGLPEGGGKGVRSDHGPERRGRPRPHAGTAVARAGAGGAQRAARTPAGADRRRRRRRRDRARRRGGERRAVGTGRADDAGTGPAAGGHPHDPLHLRPRQGRAARPDARRRLPGHGARRTGPGRGLVREGRPHRRGEPRAVPAAPVDRRALRHPPPAGPRSDRQVRARAGGLRRHRTHRRGDGRGPDPPPRLRPRAGPGRRRHRRAQRPPERPGVVGAQRPAAGAGHGPGALPLAGRVGSAVGGYSPGTVWDFGLRCVLDGVARLLERG